MANVMRTRLIASLPFDTQCISRRPPGRRFSSNHKSILPDGGVRQDADLAVTGYTEAAGAGVPGLNPSPKQGLRPRRPIYIHPHGPWMSDFQLPSRRRHWLSACRRLPGWRIDPAATGQGAPSLLSSGIPRPKTQVIKGLSRRGCGDGGYRANPV